MTLTPDKLSGHALGLHSSGMLAMQGVGAALRGAVAQQTSPATAMAAMAAARSRSRWSSAPAYRDKAGPPRPRLSHAVSDDVQTTR